MMKCFYESLTLLSGFLWTEYREKEPLMGKMQIALNAPPSILRGLICCLIFNI